MRVLLCVIMLVLSGCRPAAETPANAPAVARTIAPSSGADIAPADVAANTPVDLAADLPTEDSARTGSKPAGNRPEASGWGNLRGRFVYDGTPPAPKELRITSDVEYCCKHKPMDESLVVDPHSAGLANVVIALYRGRGDEPPPVHSSFESTAAGAVSLDNAKCCFHPRVVLLHTGQTLRVLNSDDIAHNTKIDTQHNPPINSTLPAGGSLEHRFANAELAPARVSCSIHPWMVAWVMVREDPYYAVTDKDGNFTIDNLPAGTRTFQVWHETARYVTEVRQDGKATQWTRGRFTVEIRPGETTDLGPIYLDPSRFAAR